MSALGTIRGVGLGPGDPELMTVKSDRLLREAAYVAYFRKAGRQGIARQIIKDHLRSDVHEIPMEYPVTTEIPLDDPRYGEILSAFYSDCTARLLTLAQEGHDVLVVSEGDPFFYGSFMHLHSRLNGKCPVEVVPAATGMSAAWCATDTPITWGDDIMTTLMGTLSEEVLIDHMRRTDALVIMKIGGNIDKIRRALRASNRYDAAWLIEYASMPKQTVQKLSDAIDKVTPYFSIIVVHGQGRRP